MRFVFIICFLFGISSIGVSQVEIGPRVGLSTVFTNVDDTSDGIESGDANFGFSLGLFARIGSDKLRVMPELLYSTTTTTINFKDGDGVEQIADSELNQIDLPVNLQIGVTNFLNLQGGLVGSLIVSENDGFVDKTNEAIRNYEDFTFGYQAGVGLEVGNFLIDLKYEDNLSNLSESNQTGLMFDERASMIRGMVGIKLF